MREVEYSRATPTARGDGPLCNADMSPVAAAALSDVLGFGCVRRATPPFHKSAIVHVWCVCGFQQHT